MTSGQAFILAGILAQLAGLQWDAGHKAMAAMNGLLGIIAFIAAIGWLPA